MVPSQNSIQGVQFFSRSELFIQEIVPYEYGIRTIPLLTFSFFNEKCAPLFFKNILISKPIGSPGKVVEVDRSKCGKRKYHKGRSVEGI